MSRRARVGKWLNAKAGIGLAGFASVGVLVPASSGGVSSQVLLFLVVALGSLLAVGLVLAGGVYSRRRC